MAWMARLDARAARWPRPLRWPYRALKWTLVLLGAYLLIGWYVVTFGWLTALWFIAAPLAYGILRGLQGHADL